MKYIIFPLYVLINIFILIAFPKEDKSLGFLTCEIIITPLFGLIFLVLFAITSIKNSFKDAFPQLLISLSFFAIPWKTTFIYYNFILYLFLISINIFVIYKQVQQKDLSTSKFVLIPLTVLLIGLFIIGNENYYKLRYPKANSWEPYGLTLNDFTFVKIIPGDEDQNARVNTNYIRIINQAYNYPNILIVAFQYPKESYFITGGDKFYKRGLDHEQLHFDIKELYARKIRNAINNIWYSGITEKEKLFDSLYAEEKKTQNQYDSLEYHSSDRLKAQEIWNKRIRTQLDINNSN